MNLVHFLPRNKTGQDNNAISLEDCEYLFQRRIAGIFVTALDG